MPKIRILAIPTGQHGVGKFRILDPFKYIGENHSDEIHVDFSLDVPDKDESFNNYDVVVFHSFIHKTSHESNINRIKWLKEKGIKVVIDIDDYWRVDSKHPLYHQIIKDKTPEHKVTMLRLADYITTTTPVFAQTLKTKLNVKNVIVFPNAVDPNENQFKPKPTKSDRIRFGWLGGSSHFEDINLMSSAISTIGSNYRDKTQFVMCGFDLRGDITELDKKTGQRRSRKILPHETIWFKYENVFTNRYKMVDGDYKKYLLDFNETPYNDEDENYVRKWTKEINSYALNYNNFDVSLAPLVDSEFNVNKSQLKIIEAGFHKKAVIASEINPYNIDLINAVDQGSSNSKGNSLLVSPRKNHKDWTKHMKRLIENPNMIEDLGNNLYETVKDKYSLKTVSKDRVEFFKSIIN